MLRCEMLCMYIIASIRNFFILEFCERNYEGNLHNFSELHNLVLEKSFLTDMQNYMLIPQWSLSPVTSGRWADGTKSLRYLTSGLIFLFKLILPY